MTLLNPLISVILTTYNHEKYIGEAIESILNQTLKNFELIIINDGSTDRTEEIINIFKDARIHYIYQKNQGTSTAINQGVLAAKGKYIAFMSGDDVCYPQRLERQYNYCSETEQNVLVFSWVDFINENSEIFSGEPYIPADWFNRNNQSSAKILRYFFENGNYVNAPTAFVEKKAFINSNLFHLTSIQAQDFYMWIELLGKGYEIFILPEKLLKYRVTGKTLSQSHNYKIRESFEYELLLKNFFKNIPATLFKEAFSNLIKNNNFNSEIEYELEKAFIYLNYNSQLFYKISYEKLFELLQNPYILTISKEKYNFDLPNLYNLITNFLRMNENESKKALVSIIIPCYNQARFLKEAVDSIINQVYQNWECIIVNDGSPDDTSEVAKFIIDLYKNRKIYLLEKPNGGLPDARNKGIKQSSGQYILCLDADDKIGANFLEDSVAILQAHSAVGFVYTDVQYFGAKNDKISYGDFNPNIFIRNNQATATSLFRREIFDQVGGFKTIMDGGLEDWEFWISAYENGWQGYRLAKASFYYRQHATGSMLQNLVNQKSKLQILFARIISLHPKLYTEQEILWAEQTLYQNQNSAATSKALDNYELLLTQLCRQITEYQQETQNYELANVAQIRQQIAKLWLSVETQQLATEYFGTLGTLHSTIQNIGIKEEILTQEEQSFIDEVQAYLAQGLNQQNTIQYLLAAQVYCRADQLQLQHDFSHIPHWFIQDYLRFLFASPVHFYKLGEADNYNNYLQELLNFLHTLIISDTDNKLSREIINNFAQNGNFIPLYFNEKNLKNIYIKRAGILELFLKNNGFEVNYEFTEQPVNRKKIRLGILATHFTPGSETFAYLPVYEYISRDFEVILYSLNQTSHPLEQYCKTCANLFTLLPANLSEQVNIIRADDLDILFIATNVTAVTNQICLLAMHRLARIQVTSGGSVVTTGMRHIDYYISGTLTDPSPTAAEQYREKLLKIEGTAHCFSYGNEQEQVNIEVKRENLGIAKDTVVFISAANLFKITPELINTWAKIILEVPNSVLVLLPYGPNWSNIYPKKYFESYLIVVFAKYGLLEDRFIVLDPQPVPNREEVKEYLKIADVYLDSYPFAGTTSLIEPLQINLPVIARQGHSFRSAMGAAMIQSLDVSDLVADSEESYIKLATTLGNDSELRHHKRKQIQEKMQANPSFLDSRSYSAKIERLFKQLFSNYLVETLRQNLPLRDINLIIFPDWTQSEESIGSELERVIKFFATYPDSQTTTLLIDTNNIAVEDAEIFLSSVAMNLMMNEDLDITEGLDISLLEPLSNHQWQALLPSLTARITLEFENKLALAQLPIAELSVWDWDKLMNSTLEITTV
ncbi:glycosyltransferase [Tolypothrix sp. FACHB-123]|uniref:glycosyltransferase n=1 Tax=Tolypothrix sp. FACHB-123 TaxID=2692868 RepID=UPI001686111F|nr:glycosyltransferase [Tolypothrix sp. FACHB-123]MBD2353941.1 glycosyltransferase [Tolypothrix sp. FACHB-123]